MTQVLEQLRTRAKQSPRRIVFPEATDPRVIAAVNEFQSSGLGQAVILDPPDSAALIPQVEIVRSDDESIRQQAIDQLVENRKHKGMDRARAAEAIEDPVILGALLVRIDFVDGSVAGSLATSANVTRAGIYGVGSQQGRKLVSSFFLMQLADRAVTYADCGVVPDPNADELAEIAVVSAASHQQLTQERPLVAMLSFSTKGSAEHPRVEKVRKAVEIARQLDPDLQVDGELQFDAAWLPEVAQRKAPNSEVAGRANVFIFPDLDSGNIAYKITERLGGATALGPLLQGLAKPCMDLSRGCTASDIVDVAVIASILSQS